MTKTAFLLAIGMMVSSCQSVAHKNTLMQRLETSSTIWVCEAFLPIERAVSDDTATLQQIREHNAVWEALCAN